jgi:hypothetical protein
VLGEDELAVGDYVELTSAAGFDDGGVAVFSSSAPRLAAWGL